MAHKQRQRGSFSESKDIVYVTGVDELLKRLEGMPDALNSAAKDILDRVTDPPLYRMNLFMMSHRRTGMTQSTLGKVFETGDDYVGCKVGFDLTIKRGKKMLGMPALFLDLGTFPLNAGSPHVEPSYFVYDAFHDTADEMTLAFREALHKYLEKKE